MFNNVKRLTETLFHQSGEFAAVRPGEHNPDDPEGKRNIPLEKPEKPSPMMQRIRDANKPPSPPPSVQNRLIRNTQGHVIGAVGSKVRRLNSATEIVVKNIMQEIAPVEEMMTGSVAVFPTPMGDAGAIPTPMVAPQMQPKLCPCGSGKPASECCQQQTIKVHDAINTTMRNSPVDRGSRLRKITNVLGGL